MQYQSQQLIYKNVINCAYPRQSILLIERDRIMKNADKSEQEPLSTRGVSILNAAQQLFFQQGYDETSLEMIINESGGSRRSIYNEFGNKQGLLLAVIQRQVSLQTQTLTMINRDFSPQKALEDVCFRFVQGMLSSTVRALFRLVVQQTINMPTLGELIYQKGPMAGVQPLADYLSHLVTTKELQIADCHYASQMLLEMSKGPLHTKVLLLPHHDVTDDEIKTQVERAVSIFIKAHQCE